MVNLTGSAPGVPLHNWIITDPQALLPRQHLGPEAGVQDWSICS